MSMIPERGFKICVDWCKENFRIREISCKDQFLVMSYAQLTNRDSLRNIENCLTELSSKPYYCGIHTLAKANEKRGWRIQADFAQILLKKVRPLYAKDKFRLDLDNMFMHLTAILSAFAWSYAHGPSSERIKAALNCIHYWILEAICLYLYI